MSTSKYVTIILSGVIVSSNDFTIYAENKLTTPIKSGVTRTELTNSLTPYVVLVPSATTKMVIYDNVEKCSIVLDIDENNLCQSCDINFKSYSTNKVGRISADVLTASCINNLTDYRINWYGPNSSTNIIWTTGKGSSFPYNSVQPITGNTSLYVPEGIYKPVIDKIKISGVTFSQTGDTTMGNIPIPAELNCLPSVDVAVSAFTCDNGVTSDLSQYKHKVYFQSRGNGQLPSSMYGTFRLSATTKGFGFSFEGFDIPDEFRIKFYGQNYGFEPILLEWWQVGRQVPTDFTQLPYKWSSYYLLYVRPLRKIINFKNFNLTNNDYLTVEVIPNPNNVETDWLTYFTCVDWDEPTDCGDCNTPYKIIKSSITYTTDSVTCFPNAKYTFNLSGCSFDEMKTFIPGNLGLTDYIDPRYSFLSKSVYPNNSSNIITTSIGNIWPEQTQCWWLGTSDIDPMVCDQTVTNKKIIISKNNINSTSANIKIECEDINDFNDYYNSYLANKTANFTPAQNNNLIYSGNTYYKDYHLIIPILTTPDTQCGDNTGRFSIYFHANSLVTTGNTNGFYFINIIANTIPDVISSGSLFTSQCTGQNCKVLLNTFLNYNNNTVTGSTFTYTYNKGQKFINPIRHLVSFYSVYFPAGISSEHQFGVIESIPTPINYTLAFSGVNNTLIPSLTALTCSNLTKTVYKYWYKLELGTGPNDYIFYNRNIVSGSLTNNYTKILEYSGGTFTYVDSNYVI